MENDKSKSPLVLIVLAVILIGIGSYLVFSGNNASLFGGKVGPEEGEPTPEPVPEPDPEPIPDRPIQPVDTVLAENIASYLKDRKNLDLPEEEWTVENVKLLAHGDNDTYLVSYDAVTNTEESQSVVTYKTIITIVDESISGDFPGWNGSVENPDIDLAAYNFVYYEGEEPIEEPPIEEPMEESLIEEPTVEEPVPEEPAVEEPVVEETNENEEVTE